MSVSWLFEVTERYDDGFKEAFGFTRLRERPVPGAIIQLRWLDGRLAYRVRVLECEGSSLLVQAVSEEKIPPCAATMGCLCAGHARGNDPDAACDTSEQP